VTSKFCICGHSLDLSACMLLIFPSRYKSCKKTMSITTKHRPTVAATTELRRSIFRIMSTCAFGAFISVRIQVCMIEYTLYTQTLYSACLRLQVCILREPKLYGDIRRAKKPSAVVIPPCIHIRYQRDNPLYQRRFSAKTEP
jgi:hypothetical protein